MTSFSLNTALSTLIILSLTLIIVKKNSPILLVIPNTLSYQDLNQSLSSDLATLQTHCQNRRNDTLIKLVSRNDSFIDGAAEDLPSSSFPKTHGFLKGYLSATNHNLSEHSSSSSIPSPILSELVLVHLQYYFKTFHVNQDRGILASINSYIDSTDFLQDDFDFFIGDMRFRDSVYQVMAFQAPTLDSFLIYTISNTTRALLYNNFMNEYDDLHFSDKCLVLRYLIKEVELDHLKKLLKPNPNIKVKRSLYSNDECGYMMSLKMGSTSGGVDEKPVNQETNSFFASFLSFQPFLNQDTYLNTADQSSSSTFSSFYHYFRSPRKQQYSATLSSPNCGSFASPSLVFTKREALIRSELDSTFILIMLSLFELYMTIIQIQRLETIVQQSRVSQTCILLISSLDFCVGGLCFIRCFFDPSTDQATFESVLTLAFVKLIEYACYDMKLVFMIATAQNRSRIDWITKLKYYCCFVFGFYCGVVLVSEWVGWMLEILIVFLYSFLVPQVIRNVWKNCSRPVLGREFLIFGTLFRFITGGFLWVCVFKSGGYPFYDPQQVPWTRIVILVGTILLSSILFILIQEFRGSRSMVPSIFPLPHCFDYHSLDSTLLHSSSLSHECAICFNVIRKDNAIAPSMPFSFTSTPPVQKVVRVNELMQTPCGHLFDTKCLEKWIETKLECPVCRSRIPEYY